MDYFTKALFVRLRSHRDKYLIATDDEQSVHQDRSGATRAARWEVEIVTPPTTTKPSNPTAIRLKSCYGRYLSASNTPFLLGMTGRKVVQTAPGPGGRMDSSMEWEPSREGVQVKLKARNGHFLRANGGPPPWRNSVTHDIPHRTTTQDWVLWDVEIVEVRVPSRLSSLASGELKSQDSFASAASSSPSSSSEAATPRFGLSKQESTASSRSRPHAAAAGSPRNQGRTVHYFVASDNGDMDRPYSTLHFTGLTVEDLKARLRQETGHDDILVCTRSPLNNNNNNNNKLFPLHLRLPPANAPMRVVVVPSSSKLAKTLPPALISP